MDLYQPMDISLPVSAQSELSAYGCEPPMIEPLIAGKFKGEVKQGGSVNFKNITFNPHGNGTHTECVGHITREAQSVNLSLERYFFFALLLSVKPDTMANGDDVIMPAAFKELFIPGEGIEAVIVRTLPNHESKKSHVYGGSNPPYVHHEVMNYLSAAGVNHFLIDLPSVDRESDGGMLMAHKAFWGLPDRCNEHKTITELIYVPDDIKDGFYLLELQTAPFENDAAPSRPLLYSIDFS
ncbi:MAG: cyclase family protein [Flavobacteriales bacterium]|nr:cyclase family protein [Flavobacteriales bacterium]